ncbi:class I SAM-dependent methyltransferase [Shimazuella kribbensis]|uniref:class I SAM-dependent methyltransferase n=1 Tax=Shimazuella kribbensis TaxID=139808 RepID=UPI00041B7B77|nr:methyltransferase domain-containing protein [Shimazuella kribbensis]
MIEITNPAFNYDKTGQRYSTIRQTDNRISSYVHNTLGVAKTVLNIGAGAGSYEPKDRYVIAIEPSKVMRAQRAVTNKVPAIHGFADHLPFDDDAFDAAMAMVTVHHWPDIKAGLEEIRRVTKGQILVLTFDPDALDEFWNVNYFPELIEIERKRYPAIAYLTEVLGGEIEIQKIPIPLDCKDGFQEAFYGRPEAFLEKEVRAAQSAWGFLPGEIEKQYVQSLEEELKSGEWDRKYGHYRTQSTFTGALRLIVAKPE